MEVAYLALVRISRNELELGLSLGKWIIGLDT